MSDINEQMTRNKFVEYWMKKIPDDPYTQSLYVYILTAIVFFGLLGYGITAWYGFVMTLQLSKFFSALFMTAISLISLFGLKQVRAQFLGVKGAMSQPEKEVASVDEMLKQFEK